jgi:hypothetical protein
LDSLKFIVAAHIEFEPSSTPSSSNNDYFDDEDNVNLGSAFDYQLNLQYLYQLSIGGHAREFLLEVAKILDMYSQVPTFAFNADCRINLLNPGESEVANRPKPNITTIGLHGLSLAFGVDPLASARNDTSVWLIQRINDSIMAALNKRNFPSRPMLMALNRAGQPNEENGGMARWAKWWSPCWSQFGGLFR